MNQKYPDSAQLRTNQIAGLDTPKIMILFYEPPSEVFFGLPFPGVLFNRVGFSRVGWSTE